MKRLISIMLLLVLCVCFYGCAVEDDDESGKSVIDDTVFGNGDKTPGLEAEDRGEPDSDDQILISSETENVVLYTDDTSEGERYPWLNQDDWSIDVPTLFAPVSTVDGKAFYCAAYNPGINGWTSVKADEFETSEVSDESMSGDYEVTKRESANYLKRTFYVVADKDCYITLNTDIQASDLFLSVIKYGIILGTDDGKYVEIYDCNPDFSNPYRPFSQEGAIVVKNSDSEFVPDESDFGFGKMREQRGIEDISIELKASEPLAVTVLLWNEGMDKDCIGTVSNEKEFKMKLTITE